MTLEPHHLRTLLPMHALLDAEGRVRQAGPTLERIVPAPLLGERFLDLFEVYRPRSVQGMAQLLQTEGRKLHLRLRGGTRRSLKGHLVPDGQGGAVVDLGFGIGLVDAVRDFSLTATDFAPTDLAMEMLYMVEAKSAAMKASRQLNTRLQGAKAAAEERSFTDTLTGLRNRRAMDHVLMRLGRSAHGFALMHIDLDLFKQVNDTHGHAAGDQVLRAVARILVDETRKDDTVVRIGGDEFVIVIANAVSATRLGDLALRLIARIEEPITHSGEVCRISASIGISLCAEGGCDPDEVLQHADSALYAAKRAGRGRHVLFDPETHDETPAAPGLRPAE